MLHEMSAEQLREWASYAALEPFGEERADMRSALATMHTVQASGNLKRGTKLKLKDFMLMPEGVASRRKKRGGAFQPMDAQGFSWLKGKMKASLSPR